MNWNAVVRDEFTRLGKQVDASVVEEMAQHASDAWQAAGADGEPAAVAEAQVRALVAVWCAATSGPRRIERAPLAATPSGRRAWFAGLGLDVRLAFRVLVRRRGFSLLSMAMIALAIAATTTLLSVVNGVLLNPLPQIKTDGLVRVFDDTFDAGPGLTNRSYYGWADAPQTIEGLAVWNDWSVSYEGPAGLELIQGARITSNLFPLLGIAPVLGVNFTREQETTDDSVILSYALWRERFGAEPDAIGRRLTMGGVSRTIVGVMPRGFFFPDRETRLWIAQRPPTVITRESAKPNVIGVAMTISRHDAVARLKPGVSPQQAADEAAARIAASMPGFMKRGKNNEGRKPKIQVTPMVAYMIQDVKPALWIIGAAVLLLFVTAIGNAANLQLARARAREHEAAIRAALGGSARRLFRQLFIETSALTVIGGAIGVGLAIALLRGLPAVLPEDFPQLEDIAVDGRILSAAAALAVLISMTIAFLPARISRRRDLTSTLSADGVIPVGQSLRSAASRARALIIMGQVAIAAVLLVGAALLGQSLQKQIDVNRGYVATNLLTARLAHLGRGLPPAARPAFYKDVLARLIATPGVTHAALSNELPLTLAERRAHGKTDTASPIPIEGLMHVVTTDYFAAMGIRLLSGRPFTVDDVTTSELIVIVNETFAARYLRGDPFTQTVSLEVDGDVRPCAPTTATASACTNHYRVAGIVSDVRHGRDVGESIEAEVYAARTQVMSPWPSMQFLVVKTVGDPAALAGELRSIVRTTSARGALDQVMTMDRRVMTSLAKPRLYATLLGGFAAFALLIAIIGLFGGLSYAVAQRRREIGVRTALGATPRHIVSMMMKQGTVMALSGLAIGLGAAAAMVRYLSTFLFGIEPLDARTFAAVAAALLAVALLACLIPARRAARLDALDALRR